MLGPQHNQASSTKLQFTLWQSMPREFQARMCADMAEVLRNEALRPRSLEVVAAAVSFRPKTLRQAKLPQLAGILRRALPVLPDPVFHELVVACHVERRAALLSAVYDALGIDHDGPTMHDAAELQHPDVDSGTPRLVELATSFDHDDAWFCLEWLRVFGPEPWRPTLSSALSRIAAPSLPAESAPIEHALDMPLAPTTLVQPQPQESSGPAHVVAQEERIAHAPHFTTLDRLVTRAVISSLNGVEGSFDPDELDDLVGEVSELNDQRAQSRFHNGHLDALRQQPVAPTRPGDNSATRAWYLAGHLHGTLHHERGAALRWWDALEPEDRAHLLGPEPCAGGQLVAPELVPVLLRAKRIAESGEWLATYLVPQAPKLLPQLLGWARDELLHGNPENAQRMLEVGVERHAAIVAAHGATPQQWLRDLRRRLASSHRRQGHLSEARREVDDLLASSTDAWERARLIGDRALLALGVRTIENLDLPAGSQRPTFIAALEAIRPELESSTASSEAPVALFLLALPCIANKDSTTAALCGAAERLRRALNVMLRRDSDFWVSTGLVGRARHYLSILELRQLQPELAPAAVERLRRDLADGVALHVDLQVEAVLLAATLEAPATEELARLVLASHPLQLLQSHSWTEPARSSASLRRALCDALAQGRTGLRSDERWGAWCALLDASLSSSARDLDTACIALDALESLAITDGKELEMIRLLDQRTLWDPAWETSDVHASKVNLYLRLGRKANAVQVLAKLGFSALHDEQTEFAVDILEQLQMLSATEEQLEPLRSALRLHQVPASPLPVNARRYDDVRILLIGGNEVQAGYEPELRRFIASNFPGARVDFAFTGWGSNWAKQLERLEGALHSADAVVLLTFVRTNLGRTVRRRVGESSIPWVPCTGHGLQSLQRALTRAVEVVVRGRGGH